MHSWMIVSGVSPKCFATTRTASTVICGSSTLKDAGGRGVLVEKYPWWELSGFEGGDSRRVLELLPCPALADGGAGGMAAGSGGLTLDGWATLETEFRGLGWAVLGLSSLRTELAGLAGGLALAGSGTLGTEFRGAALAPRPAPADGRAGGKAMEEAGVSGARQKSNQN